MKIGDSESDSFKYESTKIWVICFYDTEKDYYTFSFDKSIRDDPVWGNPMGGQNTACLIEREIGVGFWEYESHEEHLKHLQDYVVCTHNFFQHDLPLFKKFYPWWEPKRKEDSYILSQLFWPDREIPKGCKGAHGLDAWSRRVGREGKVVHEDWSKFNPEMLHRVIEDVKDNVAAWNVLMKEKKEWEDAGGSWDEAIKIEYGVAGLQGRQEMTGVKLDIDKAYALADEIYQEIQKIDETLLASMPPRVIRYPEVAYEREPFTKAGQLKKQAEEWINGS